MVSLKEILPQNITMNDGKNIDPKIVQRKIGCREVDNDLFNLLGSENPINDLGKYLKENKGKIPFHLTDQETKELLDSSNKQANRQEFIISILFPTIYRVLRRYIGFGLSTQELFQIGIERTINFIKDWREGRYSSQERKVPANLKIELHKCLSRHLEMEILTLHDMKDVKNFKLLKLFYQVLREFQRVYHRNPSLEEMVGEILLKFKEKRRLLSKTVANSVNEEDFTEEQERLLSYRIIIGKIKHIYSRVFPEEQMKDNDIRDKIKEKDLEIDREKILKIILAEWRELEREVVIRHLGLNGEKPLTFEQIAQNFGEDVKHIRSIYLRTIDRLRRRLKGRYSP